jgi:hypothetical protein
MATTPSLTAQAAQAQRELAVATKTLAAAQNTVIAAQKAGRTPSPEALAAVEAATTAVKSTQLATNNATAAVTSAAGKTPPSTGLGVPNSLASAGNRNGGVSPFIDPANKQLPYNVSTPSPRTGSMLSNSSGLLDTLGAVALGAAAANPLATLALASKIGGIFKSTKDVLPASTAVPKSTPEIFTAEDAALFDAAAARTGTGPPLNDPTGILAAEDEAIRQEQIAADDAAAFQTVGPTDPFGVLAAEDEAIANEEAALFPTTLPTDPNGVLAAEDEAIAQSDAEVFQTVGPTDPTGVLAAEDEAIRQEQIAADDAAAFPTTLPTDPTGVLAAEDEAILQEQIAADDAAAFSTTLPIDDPTGVLAAEDEALLQEEIAADDAAAFRLNEAVSDPTGVLAAEDEALRQEEIARSDAEAFPTTLPTDPTGVLAAEDAAIAEQAAAQGDADAFPTVAPTGVTDPTVAADFAANPDAEAEQDNLNAAIKQGTLDKARAQNTIANQRKNPNNGDWRVKLRLAPGANYLYNAPEPGILNPLKQQGGVIFPYTPTISTSYKANYASYDLTHSNYKGYYYQNSAVEPVTLSCPFTAQSTAEAEYLLAVIHFFKSVTKMFYGQDPERGTPPPLVYLTGLGEYQFNEHPCVVQSFTYELPVDVDYIRARSPNINNSNMLNQRQNSNSTGPGATFAGGLLGPLLGGAVNTISRLANAGLPKGAMAKPPAPQSLGLNSPTYVPTKMNISISLLPIQSRKQQSQNFSLRQYANGDLLKGGFW